MPQLDKTGPRGQGPRTGRGLGPCGAGMGWGRMCGWSRGYGFGRRKFISSKNEMAAIQEEEKILEDELAAVREEMAALKEQKK